RGHEKTEEFQDRPRGTFLTATGASAILANRSAACLKPQRPSQRDGSGMVRKPRSLRTRCAVGHSAVRARRNAASLKPIGFSISCQNTENCPSPILFVNFVTFCKDSAWRSFWTAPAERSGDG